MLSRRQFCQLAGSIALAPAWLRAAQASPRPRLAIVCTHWIMQSHAQHMGDRFLVGYPTQGAWHQPPFEVVSLYVDQKPEGDQSAQRADEFGFSVYPTIAEALCQGGNKLAVDAVLIIGEHGDYPLSDIGQKKYPRYEFFKAVTDVFRKSGKAVPVFNDKHLSWNYDWAKEMVALSKELNFGFAAGSSLPATWRMPAIDYPWQAPLDEAMIVAFGPVDIYDFHALETLQCMTERRKGGETGVAWVEATRGKSVFKGLTESSWEAGGWNPKLLEACLSRSQTLAQAREGFGHRYPTNDEIASLTTDPICYRIQYRDGSKATTLLMNGLVEDFTFAATIAGEPEPISTMFHLSPRTNVVYSAALMEQAEQLFLTGKAVAPIERTLLTSGLVTACMTSLARDSRRLETPWLDVSYQRTEPSTFWRS